MNNDNLNQHYNGEIDLRKILNSLKERSLYIYGFTGIVTLIAIGYVLFLTPLPQQYKIETTFLKPNESSIVRLNQYSALTDKAIFTAESVFNKFLTTLNSPSLQKQVFIDGGYSEKLDKQAILTVSIDSYADGFEKNMSFELPHILRTETSNPDINSEFLDEVLATAENKTINFLINLQKLKISNRLNEINTERRLLMAQSELDRLSQIKRIKEADTQKLRENINKIERVKLEAKTDRLSQIKRIKEKDVQKLREINNQIDRARLKAKTDRINQIVVLSNAAQLASSLGITENNFRDFNTFGSNINLLINPQSKPMPEEWYLYGEVLLLEMIKSLESRKSDDPYIEELALLNNQIKETNNNTLLQILEERLDDDPFIEELALLNNQIKQINNNTILQTLEERLDDDPFIEELALLNNQIKKINNNTLLQTLEERLDDSPFNIKFDLLAVEAIKLESIRLDRAGINTMQLYRLATSEIIPPKNTNILIVMVALIGSFLLSLVIILLMNALKEDNDTKIQKGK